MDTLVHLQGDEDSNLTPLFLIHAVSGLALPYLGLGPLSAADSDEADELRAIYGISSPVYSSKSYRLPSSVDEVARQYISLIKKEVQSHGPYLLGGWSLGGVIALKMASILEAQGETVLHVIMIDSANPEHYPSFVDRAEHEHITSLTYNNIAGRMKIPASLDEDDSSTSSESLEDDDDDDDEFNLVTMLPRMRRHIHNGVNMIASVYRKQFLTEPDQAATTLVKCSSPSHPSPKLRDFRKDFVQKCFHDECMGWQPAKFRDFRTVRFAGQHDSAFDKKHVGELTRILRSIVAGLA